MRIHRLNTSVVLLLSLLFAAGDLNANLDEKPAPAADRKDSQAELEALARRLPEKVARLQAKAEVAQQDGRNLSEVAKVMEEFQRLMEGGQPQEAEKVLEKALALLGDVKIDEDKIQKNAVAFQPGHLLLQRKMSKFQQFFGMVQKNLEPLHGLMQEGKIEEAMEWIDKALAVLGEKKEDEEGFESLGVTPDEIQRKMSRIEEKLGPLSKEVEKIPALVQQGKFEEADKKADSLLKQIEKWNPKAYAALKDPPASPKIDPAKLPPSLRQKLQSLQANIQNWEAEGKDLSQFESDLKKVEPLIQKGEAKEAEALIDKLLKKFDSVSKPN